MELNIANNDTNGRHSVLRHTWIFLLVLCISVLFSCPVATGNDAAADGKNPLNVLLLTLDDMGYGTSGVEGCTVPVITPHVDALASEGMMFTHGYVAVPMCGPSRGALLSGRYPHCSGMMGHGRQPPESWEAPPSKTPSLSTYLHDRGYRTGALLKYRRTESQNTWDVTYGEAPYGAGFDDRNPESFYQRTKEFIASAKEKNKPFFLYANPIDPHRPWAGTLDEQQVLSEFNDSRPYPKPGREYTPKEVDVPECLLDLPGVRENLVPYYEALHRGDQCIGGILNALKESGLADNTLVVFLSDNGMGVPGAKNTLYPHGTRTPIIMKLPGAIKPGMVDRRSIVCAIDIMPTVLEFCRLPGIDGIEGRSVHDVVTGKEQMTDREYALTTFDYWADSTEKHFFPQRSIINKEFCYIWNSYEQRSGGQKVVPMYWNDVTKSSLSTNQKLADRIELLKNRPVEEFYDLSKDPGCWNNLIHDEEYQEQIGHFRTILKREMVNSSDPERFHYRY